MADITLTSELLHSAATAGCGWTKAQLLLLGVPWPPRSGWLSALVGRTVPADVWEQFLALRGIKSREIADPRRKSDRVEINPKKKFKTHDTLGRPLCRACGRNPRRPDIMKCGRCVRVGNPVQWDWITDFTPPDQE